MRLLRFLTIITFLFVSLPETTFGFPIIAIIIFSFMGRSPFHETILTYLTVLSIFYNFISLFLQHTPLTRKLNIVSIFIYYAYLLQFTNEFIKYPDEVSLYTILVFLFVSILNLVITILQLTKGTKPKLQ